MINSTNITENTAYDSPVFNMQWCNKFCTLTWDHVNFSYNNYYVSKNSFPYDFVSGIFSFSATAEEAFVQFTQVTVMSNTYYRKRGGAVHISVGGPSGVYFDHCTFVNNTGVRGAAVYVDVQNPLPGYDFHCPVFITNSIIEDNLADDSVFYINVVPEVFNSEVSVNIYDSHFVKNFGVCVFVQRCTLTLGGNLLFANNSAENGAALYIGMYCRVELHGSLQFIDNSAVSHGGAIYVELNFGCSVFHYIFLPTNAEVSFINTISGFGGNSLYFSVSKYCSINTNYSDQSSLMYVPYHFHYFQSINGTMVTIPYDYNYTQLNITHFPVVTSPYHLILYGDRIEYLNNIYFMAHRNLGIPATFNAILLDYFDKPAEDTEFHVQCIDCNSDLLLVDSRLVIDNSSPLEVSILGGEIFSSANVTLSLYSNINYYYRQIEVILVLELVPCPDHPGYTYSAASKGCVCYHHDVVECYDGYSEIKRGYWFGTVDRKAVTSLCPSQYCRFADRQKTREGFFELPDKTNDQCEPQRSGPACGECKEPRYTLAYDSTDCISVDHCSAGMTAVVVASTCLYWISLVIVVFSIMYFNFRLSSGYFHGLIYYYSMVAILLSTNPYISDGAFQFISILSGFAQLNPQFLGKLCLVRGMSGIDQLFIHYSHAVAVSLLLFGIVLAAKYSRRMSKFIGRCIIRVFCLLLLLAYTSLASTSLQLLRPLVFTGINEVYTYPSPSIKYFRDRHLFYGIVALLCELIIGIGLPLLLLLEPFLKRKFNFARLKPILDQYQGCYKNRYSWFGAYYLICRQVIMVIVLFGNRNYHSILFYLLLTCTVTAAFHMFLRPYKIKLLNVFDGLILQFMLIVVIISSFDFLQSASTPLVLVLVTLPLIIVCIGAVISKILHYKRHYYLAINEESDDDDER